MPERPKIDQLPPLKTFELPPDLAEFLQTQDDMVCVMQATDQGTAFVVKLPRAEIEQLHSAAPVGITHELYPLAQAPVLRTIVELYDMPNSCLTLEMFTNVGDDQQAQDFAALSRQSFLPMVFYDEWLEHRRTRRVTYSQGEAAAWLLQQAQGLYAGVPFGRYDFDAAKELVLARRRL